MFGMIIFILVVIGLFALMCFSLKKENNNIDIQVSFSQRFDRLLEKVTNDERKLYQQIISKIEYTHPEKYEITYKNGDYDSIRIGKIYIQVQKVETKRNKYECVGLNIEEKDDVVTLLPPKEQFELFDLLVEYLLWKLEVYYEQKRKDEEKQISKEHQAAVKKALKILK